MAKFIGGPYDGQDVDYDFINAVGHITPLQGPSGARQFIALPPPEEGAAMRAGKIEKLAAKGPLYVYERTVAFGGFEYHHAPKALEAALAEQHTYQANPDQETQRRRGEFAKRADELIERVKDVKLKADTEVALLRYVEDRHGNRFGPDRTEITPTTSVTIPGDKAKAGEWAASLHKDAVIGNINSLVRGAATGYFHPHGRPDVEVRFIAFDLEIKES